jgi:hypothetical protein
MDLLNEAVFGGWGLLLPWAIVSAVVGAALALPSAIATRFFPRSAVYVWVLTVAAAIASVWVWHSGSALTGPVLWGWTAQWTLFLVVPQIFAYLLERHRPWRRVAVAGALGAGAVVLWMIAGAFSRATPD